MFWTYLFPWILKRIGSNSQMGSEGFDGSYHFTLVFPFRLGQKMFQDRLLNGSNHPSDVVSTAYGCNLLVIRRDESSVSPDPLTSSREGIIRYTQQDSNRTSRDHKFNERNTFRQRISQPDLVSFFTLILYLSTGKRHFQ